MQKKLFFIISVIVALGLVIGIPFILNNDVLSTHSNLPVYIVSKVLFGLFLVCMSGYLVFSKTANSVNTTILIINLVAQFVPLIVRVLINTMEEPLIINIIVLALFFIGVLGLNFALITTNKKMVVADEKFAGDEMELQHFDD